MDKDSPFGVINLQTYSRPHLLEQCLTSIYSMETSLAYKKLIILQIGNKTVEKLVSDFADSMTTIIEVDGSNKSPLQNMNHNRWLALDKAFRTLNAQWVLSVEEDVVLAKDTLLFIEQVFKTYIDNGKFRGINLGSILSDVNLLETYSLQRFGFHGCGSVMTKNTWKIVKKLRIEQTLNSFALDGALEGIAKSGFMVTPNVTMYLDNGWDSGTHNKSDKMDPHFVANRESWQIRNRKISRIFTEQEVLIPWRSDCIPYKEEDNLRYFLLSIFVRLYHTKSFVRARKFAKFIKHRFYFGIVRKSL